MLLRRKGMLLRWHWNAVTVLSVLSKYRDIAPQERHPESEKGAFQRPKVECYYGGQRQLERLAQPRPRDCAVGVDLRIGDDSNTLQLPHRGFERILEFVEW